MKKSKGQTHKQGQGQGQNQNQKQKPVLADLLEEDKPIAGQEFACISFISPEHIIKKRELFMFEQFVKKWDFNKSMEKFVQFLNFLSYKYSMDFNELSKEFQSFVEEERRGLSSSIEDEYKTFLDQNESSLEKQFNKEHQFQTSVRGIKIRGCFPSQEEAEMRCKLIRELDPNHDVYVGPVGMWMPFHPEAYKTGRVEYLNDELNQLMHEKVKNEQRAKEEFDLRVKESKQKAIEDNRKMAEKTGNALTQTINPDGQLVGMKPSKIGGDSVSKREGQGPFTEEGVVEGEKQELTLDELQSRLFEGDNIVTGKTDNGQSLLVSGPFATKK